MKCKPRPGTSNTLRDMVDAYIRDNREDAAKELQFFAIQRTLSLGEHPKPASRERLKTGQ